MKKRKSPTRGQRPRKAPTSTTAKSRSKPTPPEIQVIERGPNTVAFHKAHLRNKKGYIYLCWRAGKHVHTFYLGKAPQSSPTPSAAIAPAADLRTRPRRRTRKAKG